MKKNPPILEARNVSKLYTQEGRSTAALQEASIAIDQGSICGIIGLSGAGKSTCLRALAGLISPSSGNVFFKEADIHQMSAKEMRAFRRKIGMIFQHFNLLSSRTVAGNVAYPLEIANVSENERQRRIEELLGFVRLSSKKNDYPSSLSGGEKQRVGIARALSNQPEILFCDEATSALDPKTTSEILDLLKMVNQKLGVTIVLITHDMGVIKQICNQVAVLDAGKVVEQGPVSKVFADPQHPITQRFIQSTTHDIPKECFKPASPNRKLLRLRFKGDAANEPIISQITAKFHVEANILMGWIDKLQTTTIGTLIIELTGSPEGIAQSLTYVSDKGVQCEVLEHAL